jgi:beta-lactamase superfamily II metal-dependent hydrolase
MMFEITLLPARQGDAIWVRWGEEDDPHQMMIDMGTEEIGDRIREKIEALPADRRKFDLLVVSHVDRDHIGGVLTCLADAAPVPGLAIEDVWFNGFQHLKGGSVKPADTDRSGVETMGAAQGERLSSWLRKQVWNREFDGAPVQRVPGEAPQAVTLHDGLQITILGPTPARLEAFVDRWETEVEIALKKGTLTEVSPGLESLGSKHPPVLEEVGDLEFLAETEGKSDNSKANGSSIVMLLEYQDHKILLSGDAFSDDLVDGIKAVSGDGPLELDAFKLPHHCSQKNVFRSLVEAVDCQRWLVSTDGTQHRHPDAVALARVIAYSKVRTPMLMFNEPSKYNGWWDNHDWKTRYDYCTEYGDEVDGITLRL